MVIEGALEIAALPLPAGGGSSSSSGPKGRVKAYLSSIASSAQAWCGEHWLSWRALKTAVSVRDQLALLAAGAAALTPLIPRPFSTCGEDLRVLRKALLLSCGGGAGLARRLPGCEGGRRAEYRIAGSDVPVALHPTSVIVAVRAHCAGRVGAARAAAERTAARGGGGGGGGLEGLEALLSYPELVVYSELVHTSRTFMRVVTRVEPEWLLSGGTQGRT